MLSYNFEYIMRLPDYKYYILSQNSTYYVPPQSGKSLYQNCLAFNYAMLIFANKRE